LTSDENIDLVRRIYDSGVWSGAGDPRALQWHAADCEFVNPDDAVVTGVRRGHDGIRAAVQSLDEAFASWRSEPHGFHAAGDKVLVETRFVCVGMQSGIEFTRDQWHVWTLRDGLAQSVAWFHDADAAREAAGL
jgi:ketosteroid isomerase-like protein